ncbi:hypothetical protein F4806DRAFT_490569 [Annulohypoxylon nitens]|nr:hypothetical protein F4806DRAFT_490569 [Annulohypoxylon nitens]
MDIKAQLNDAKIRHWRDKRHKPLLLWAIEMGKNIDYIQHCIDIYRREYPEGLEGEWFHDRKRGNTRSRHGMPLIAATKSGRLDVIQALVKSGIDPKTFRDNVDIWLSSFSDIVDVRRKILDHDDIAKFLLSNGFRIRYHDLWIAVKAGFFEVVDKLLLDLIFAGTMNRGQIVIKATLSLAIMYPVADPGIIRPLLRAMVDPNFDIINSATDAIQLNKGGKVAEILEVMLSEYPSKLGESESERLQTLEDLLIVAVNFGSVEIARSFINTFGMKYSRFSLKAAILSCNAEMIDEVINSGISPNSVERMEFNRPLQYALAKCSGNLIPAFRLLYHGADYTDVSEYQKNRLRDDLLHFPGFCDYILKKSDNDLRVTPNRSTFAKLSGLFPSSRINHLCDNEGYLMQVNALACLMIGDEYWQELRQRIELIRDGKCDPKATGWQRRMRGKLCMPWGRMRDPCSSCYSKKRQLRREKLMERYVQAARGTWRA